MNGVVTVSNLNAIGIANEMLEKTQIAYRKRISEKVAERVGELCDLCELLGEEFDAVNFTAMASNVLDRITLSVDADDMTFYHGRSNPFFEGIKAADRVTFSITRDGGIRVSLSIDNIWEA